MHAVDLIYSSMPLADRLEPPEAPQVGVCCVTGEDCLTLPSSLAIKPSFTDHGLLRAPGSNRVGIAAYQALNYKPERQSLWWTDGQLFQRPTRADVRQRVLGAQYGVKPWSGYVTTSYKKHGALRATVNTGRRATWLFETVQVDCSDTGKVNEWWHVMTEAQKQGVSRTSMEAMDMPAGILSKLDTMGWHRFRQWALPKHRSPLYGFLCYLLPSMEELKEAGVVVKKAEGAKKKQEDIKNDEAVQGDLFA